MKKASGCATAKCDRRVKARGLCERCYQIWHRSGTFQPALTFTAAPHRLTDVDVEAATGVCSVCGPTDVRIRKSKGHECMTVRRRSTAESNAKRPRGNRKPVTPASAWRDRLKSAYGMTLDDWHNLILEQEGRCAICNEQMREPNTDHCHSTGRVRGILCRPCNLGLGFFRDNEQRLAAARVYLGAEDRLAG